VQEVEREQLGAAVGTGDLQGRPDLAVHPPAGAVGESLVGDLADQPVPEAQLPRGVTGDQEVGQAVLQLVVELERGLGQQGGELADRELAPEDGGVPQDAALRRRQLVDLGGQDLLDGLRQALDGPRGAGPADQ